jgi:hypothetical protein
MVLSRITRCSSGQHGLPLRSSPCWHLPLRYIYIQLITNDPNYRYLQSQKFQALNPYSNCLYSMRKNETDSKNGLYILALVLLASPFYLNDFANLYIKNWRWWLFLDYTGMKLFPFLVTLWLIYSKKMRASEFGLTTQSIPSSLMVFSIVALVGTIIDQNGAQLIAELPGYPPLGGMPAITSPV